MPSGASQSIAPAADARAGDSSPAAAPPRGIWLKLAAAATLAAGGTSLLFLLRAPTSIWTPILAIAFFLCAASAHVFAIARRLPAQSALACGAVVWAVTFVALTLAVGYPALLGRIDFARWPGASEPTRLPWQVPALGVLWIALVLGARETLRSLLRPWRRDKYYGFFLLAGTALLVLTADLAVQPFAFRLAGWWSWQGPFHGASWQGVPLQCFATSFVLALLAATFATPWLIPKHPIQTAADCWPLAIWLLVQSYFAVGNVIHKQWMAVGLTAAISAVLILGSLAARRNPVAHPKPA